jgi:hypothetical protein
MLACLFLSRLVPHPAEDISSRSIRCFFLVPLPCASQFFASDCHLCYRQRQEAARTGPSPINSSSTRGRGPVRL